MFNEVNNCIICGSSKNGWKEVLKLNKDQALVRCGKCGLVFNDRQEADLSSVYADDYFVTDKKNLEGGYFDYSALENAINRNHKFAYDFILKHSRDKKRVHELIDIGCGWGYFLKQFNCKPNFKLSGVEINSTGAREAKKYSVEIFNTALENFQTNKRFDFVTCFEFIEHTLNPDAVFKKISQITDPGGFVIMTTPNIENALFKILKRRWPAIHPSSHNFYFSKNTLSKLADNNGFDVVYLKTKHIFWTNVFQFRKRLKELFPISAKLLDRFGFLDSKRMVFFSGGLVYAIFKKRG